MSNLETTVVVMTENMGRELKTFFREMSSLTSDLRVRWEVWNVSKGVLVPARPPAMRRTLYIPMISPSARLRGRPNAPFYGELVLEWLEAYGARVLGSSRALRLSSRKTLQALAFIKAGFLQPPQVTVCDSELSARAARKTLRFVESVNDPRYTTDPHSKHEGFLKPEVGSEGAFVRRFRDCSELERISQARPVKESSLRGAPWETYVLQRAVPGCTDVRRSGAGGYKIVRVFHRFEFVDRRMLYCVRAVANDDARSLCPCDESSTQGVEWGIVSSPAAAFGEPAWRDFSRACKALMKNEPDLRTFTIKALFDEERAGLVPIGIDCCDMPRYNPDLERRTRTPSGYAAFAEMLRSEIAKFGREGEAAESE